MNDNAYIYGLDTYKSRPIPHYSRDVTVTIADNGPSMFPVAHFRHRASAVQLEVPLHSASRIGEALEVGLRRFADMLGRSAVFRNPNGAYKSGELPPVTDGVGIVLRFNPVLGHFVARVTHGDLRTEKTVMPGGLGIEFAVHCALNEMARAIGNRMVYGE